MKRFISLILLVISLFSFASAEVPTERLYGREQLALSANAKVLVEEIKLNSAELSLKKGKSAKIKFTIAPKSATNKSVKWKTSNKKVATVDKNGKVIAKGYGFAKITCSAKDGSGVKAFCIINVPVPLEKAKYIGNKDTLKLHRPTCRTIRKMLDENKIAFLNREDAIELDYQPCKVCHP